MEKQALVPEDCKELYLESADIASDKQSLTMQELDYNSTLNCTGGGEKSKVNTCSIFTENESSISEEGIKLLEQKRLFMEKLEEKIQQSTGNTSILSKEKYDAIVGVLLSWNEYTVPEKKKIGYRIAQKYYVISLEGKKPELYWKKNKTDAREDKSNNHERVLHKENIFDAIRKTHEEAIHAKGRTLTHKIREKYGKSIPQWVLKLFTDLCPHCIEMREVRKSQVAGHKPILSNQFGERGQADLIDYQSLEFNGYKYLLVYQDHCTKFVECCPLKNKRKRTTSRALIDIFTSIGAPRILHTDNGKEFNGLALDVPLAE